MKALHKSTRSTKKKVAITLKKEQNNSNNITTTIMRKTTTMISSWNLYDCNLSVRKNTMLIMVAVAANSKL